MKKLTIFFGIATILYLLAPREVLSKEAKEKVIYKYKKYERFDLGNLEVKGNIIAPGDLSVMERERKVFDLNLLDRKEFDRENFDDILNLR